jgi:hypothetical protein
MPVRKVNNHRGSAAGRFPSIKMKRMIAFESLLERDFIYLLDYDPDIGWFEEQPLTIEYVYDHKILHYTPDFHVIDFNPAYPEGQNVLVECKPERFVETDENRRKFAAAQAWCSAQGWQFRTATEQQIRSGYRLQNIQLLTQYARQRADQALQKRILSFLLQTEVAVSIQEVAQEVLPQNLQIAMASILRMAYCHQVYLDIHEAPISGKTVISRLPQAPREVTP